jgi:CBS domain containing-hemolysin-like protein
MIISIFILVVHVSSAPRYSQQDENTQNQAGLRTDDRTLISGAISFSNKNVADVQTPITDIFMLHIDTRCDHPIGV